MGDAAGGFPSAERRDDGIALVAGATAGHLAPALAAAEALRAASPGRRCVLVLPRTTGGSWILDDAGMPVVTIDAQPFYGRSVLQRLGLPLSVARATLQARHVLREQRCGLVLAFGGFGSFEASLAAASLGLPVIVHEANARAGLSTRLAARMARRVLLAEAGAARDFPAGRCETSGMPVRRAFLEARASRRSPRQRGELRLLVVGGSLGSRFLDRHLPATIGRVAGRGIALTVTHIGGHSDAGAIDAAYRKAAVTATVLPHTRDMATLLADADFVVSRAGASSLAEIAVVAVPSLFVPLPDHAGAHQQANLVAAASRAPIWWIREDEWNDDTVAALLASRLADPEWMNAASRAVGSLAVPGAAEHLARVSEDMFGGRER